MNFFEAEALAGLVEGVAVYAATSQENKRHQNDAPIPQRAAKDCTETTLRESAGGTVTETTKDTHDGIVTTTKKVTSHNQDGGKETSTTTTTKPVEAPRPTKIQNDTGPVQGFVGGGIAFQVDQRKVTRPDEEGRCIVIQLRRSGYYRHQFMGQWEDGIFADLTSKDFYNILDEINACYRGCCPPLACYGNTSRRVVAISRLNKEYSDKNISMRVETRLAMETNLVMDLEGDPNATPARKYYLVIDQL